MPPQAFDVESFGGLDLTDDPQEASFAATDLMNIVLPRGRIMRRNGYSKFTAAVAASPFQALATVPGFSGPSFPYVFGGTSAAANNLTAYLASVGAGAVIATASVGNFVLGVTAARVGTASNQYVYVGTYSAGGNKVQRFDGATFTDVTAAIGAATPFGAGGLLALERSDNRLVMAPANDNRGYVAFSDPGAPETFSANNFVQLSPNDGGIVTGLVSWGNLVFAFKSDQFFVFYGTGTSGSGTPVFNYRPVAASSGIPSRTPIGSLATSGRDGVYYANDSGVWMTTGGPPQKLSRAIDGLFNETYVTAGTLSGLPYSGGQFTPSSLAYIDEELYIAGNDSVSSKTLVLNLRTNTWTIHNFPTRCIAGSVDEGSMPRIYFGYQSGSNDIGIYRPSVLGASVPANATDDGATINALFRTGDLGMGAPMSEKWVREWIYDGAGTWNVGVAVNDNAAVPTLASVALGSTSGTVIGNARDRRGVRGRMLALHMTTTGLGAQINRVTGMVQAVRAPGLRAA